MTPEGLDLPRHNRTKKQRYGLVGEVCKHCDTKLFPPRDVCTGCGEEAKEMYTFSGKGEIYSFTTIYDPPAGFEENAPYTIAMIKLDEGPLVTAQLTDFGEEPVKIGTPVEMVTRKLKSTSGERGMLVYGYKFRPVLQTNH